MSQSKTPSKKQLLAEQEIKFKQNPNALRNHALKILAKAKALETQRIKSGFKWRKVDNRTTVLIKA